jgi:hypothetical protein
MNLAEWLVRTARRQPDAPALLSGEDLVATYAGFAAMLRASALSCAPGTRSSPATALPSS